MASKDYFDRIAEGYLDKSEKGLWAWMRKKEQTALMAAVEPFKGMTCLELGCGAGFYTKLLSQWAGSLLVVVDFSLLMLQHLNISGIKKIRGDIQRISFRRVFDRVVCAGAIEFLPDPDLFFINLKQYLSPNGVAILLIPRKGLFGYFYKMFHLSHGVKVRLFSKNDLRSLLDPLHLHIQKITSPTPMTYILSIKHE